ncbi:MAG: exodeoxyribonuclease VII large subunit [Pseudomonadales bacterium]|nr:exodeoxyribonuclease VII large subunit [Pseudomonadales bacterium]
MTSLFSNTPPDSASVDTPFSVSELNRAARYLLEENFPAILVEGEISNLAMPASGHWYLTLKDEAAQVRCAMFRNRNQLLRFRPRDGMQVLVKARVSLYEGRGDFQLLIERMEELGDGALRRAFDVLREKLFKEGLFDARHKKKLSALPRHVGVITSPTGAAIRDIISVFGRRFPAIKITIIPVAVQGQGSAAEMIHALALANRREGCLEDLDVLIVSRGGGSLEDLWSFNDEGLARAIFASELPVVSAVGHEVDFTIADFVADLRAATPSAAAELLSPDQQEYRQLLRTKAQKLQALIRARMAQDGKRLAWLARQLKHPGRRLQEQAQRLDELEARLRLAFNNHLFRTRSRIRHLYTSLLLHSPLNTIRHLKQDNLNLGKRNLKAIIQGLQQKRQALAEQSHALHTVSPLSTLSRGYSITGTATGKVIHSVTQVRPGEHLITRLHQGRIFSTVDSLAEEDEP